MDLSIKSNLRNPYISIFFKVTSFFYKVNSLWSEVLGIIIIYDVGTIHLIKAIIGIIQELIGFIIIKKYIWEYVKTFSQ